MRCQIAPCPAEAVGEWRWAAPYCGEVRMNVPLCDEHRRQKARSKTPGRFHLYEEATA